MAERFTGQRCQDCQGGLIYNKKEKYWECPYCGKIYERELRFDKVQIDGLAGINDLVRSTLSKLLSLDFEGAEKDLSECEKIDHASVGTLIAKLSFSLFKSFYIKDRQVELNKMNTLLSKLNRDFQEIDEPEEILYDFIESSDIYALLVIVYGMTGQSQRKDRILELLDCEEVLNPNVSKYLINILLKENRIEDVDILLDKINASNCKYAIMVVLNSYPSIDKKITHIDNLLNRLNQEIDVAKFFDNYFNSNNDSETIVIGIFLSAVAHKVNFDTTKVIDAVLQNCTTIEIAKKTFESISSNRLDETTANAILSWAIKKCTNTMISAEAFNSLYKSNSVFEITDNEMKDIFISEQSDEIKYEKAIQLLKAFKTSSKSLDKMLAFHILQNKISNEYRKKFLNELLERVSSVPLNVVEEYILNNDFDELNKSDILKELFAKVRIISIASGVFSEYLKTKIDSPKVREEVIKIFLEYHLIPEPDALSFYLLNKKELHSNNLLNIFIERSCKVSANTFDKYIMSLSDPNSYNLKIAELSTKFGFTMSSISFQKYLLSVSEPENKKIEHTKKYLSLCANEVRNIKQTISLGEISLEGNIAQIYFFTSEDEIYVMQEIIKILAFERIKVDMPLELIPQRKKIKIKKFIESNESILDKKIKILSQEIL